jgi:hypothetical protein
VPQTIDNKRWALAPEGCFSAIWTSTTGCYRLSNNIHMADAADVALRKITALQGKMQQKPRRKMQLFSQQSS